MNVSGLIIGVFNCFVDLVLLVCTVNIWLYLVLVCVGDDGFDLLDGLIDSYLVCGWLVLAGFGFTAVLVVVL